MIKILVTGAKGQLGWTITQLADKYQECSFEFYDSKQLDITNKEEVEEIIEKSAFDYCINCAAFTNVEEAEKNPMSAFNVNAEGVRNLAESCKKHNVILIHISTDYVFDGEKEVPYTIHDKPNPINEYGRSKLKGEQYVQEILDNYFIVRTSWVYCKEHGNNFYRTILKKAKEGQDLKIIDSQIGRPTNTYELVGFLIEEVVINKKPFGKYHYSDGEVMSWYGFAEKIIEENGLKGKIELLPIQNYRTLARRPKNSIIK